MKVIYKAPGCAPEPRDIPNTLEELQASVGGYIEAVRLTKDVVLICNEDGVMLNMPYNIKFLGLELVGPILLVGVDGEEFTDLSPENTGFLMDALRKAENCKKEAEWVHTVQHSCKRRLCRML